MWVDELGWPWTKHGCFDEPQHRDSYFNVASLANRQRGLETPNLALLNRISHIGSQQGPKLEIGCLDGSLIIARGASDLDYQQLLGELLILSRESSMIRHASLGDFPVTILPDKRFEEENFTYRIHRDSELKTKCPLCPGSFYEDEREEHMAVCPRTFQRLRPINQVGKPRLVRPRLQKEWVKCPKCNCSIEKQNLEGHLRSCSGQKAKQPIKARPQEPAKESRMLAQIRAKNEARQKRIQSEIQRVIKEALLVADSRNSVDDNFSLVKQEAIRLVRGLSPHIRREVETFFSSQKWSPLKKT